MQSTGGLKTTHCGINPETTNMITIKSSNMNLEVQHSGVDSVAFTFNRFDFDPVGSGDDKPITLDQLMLKEPFTINGIPFHIQATAVEIGPDGIMRSSDGSDDELGAYDKINQACPQTCKIKGIPDREYLLMIYPHGR